MNVQIDITKRTFEQAIKFLQENLQYLADKGEVGKKFISIQNNKIKALINYYNSSEQRIRILEKELLEKAFSISKLLTEQDIKIESLEAVCLLHGITDFPYWLSKGRGYLVAEFREHQKNQTFIVPEAIHEYIQALPIASKNKLINLLKTGRNTKIEQLETITKKLKK